MGFGGMPPKAKKEKAKKEKKPKAEGAKGGKRKKKRSESYSIYIYKVLKQVHPEQTHAVRGAWIQQHLHTSTNRVRCHV